MTVPFTEMRHIVREVEGCDWFVLNGWGRWVSRSNLSPDLSSSPFWPFSLIGWHWLPFISLPGTLCFRFPWQHTPWFSLSLCAFLPHLLPGCPWLQECLQSLFPSCRFLWKVSSLPVAPVTSNSDASQCLPPSQSFYKSNLLDASIGPTTQMSHCHLSANCP